MKIPKYQIKPLDDAIKKWAKICRLLKAGRLSEAIALADCDCSLCKAVKDNCNLCIYQKFFGNIDYTCATGAFDYWSAGMHENESDIATIGAKQILEELRKVKRGCNE